MEAIQHPKMGLVEYLFKNVYELMQMWEVTKDGHYLDRIYDLRCYLEDEGVSLLFVIGNKIVGYSQGFGEIKVTI